MEVVGNMKKVLFIAYFFPPLSGSGVPRSLKFARYLPEFGWLPIVISADEKIRYMKDYGLLGEIPEAVKVHRVGHRRGMSEEMRSVRARLKLAFDFPDRYKYWCRPAYKKAKAIIQKEKIDLILSTSGPYTSHFIAMKLKKEFNIPWVADFRDPWSENAVLQLHIRNTLVWPLRNSWQWKTVRAERKVSRIADKIITVPWHHKQQLCEQHGVSEDMVEVITNGYDESDFEQLGAISLYPRKPTIIFMGSFPGSEFREIFLKFLGIVRELNKGIEVICVGRVASQMQNVQMDDLTLIYNLPRRKALALCSGSDFLLLVLPSHTLWEISGKLFEYLRIRKPILGICPEGGDAARIIKGAEAGYILSYNEEQMKQQLTGAVEKWERGEFADFHPNMEYVTQYERKELTRRLSELLNGVAG